MRRLSLLVAAMLLGATPALAAAPPDPRFVAVERAVEATKAAMMGDPANALAKAHVAVAAARRLPSSREAQVALATTQWLEGEAQLYLNKPEAAVAPINSALALAERVAPRTKLHGDLMRSHGAIAASRGQLQAALADYQRAFEAFRAAGVVRSQAIALQDIGQIYWDAGDYPRTLQYYRQASELYDDDPSFALTSHNNMGEVLRKLGRRAEAQAQYDQALVNARELASPLLEVRILANLAIAQTELRQFAAAERNLSRALRLAQSGEAEGWRPQVLGSAAKTAAARGQIERAAALLREAFAGADLATTDLSYREFHEVAADVFARLGETALALDHMKAFQRLDSEARNLVASNSSQLLSARFDFANQNLKISQLRQGQLERDIAMERQRSRYRTTLLSGLVLAGGLVLGLLLYGYVKIRRSRDEVRAANVDLASSNIALEKALKAKTEFLATTSHEIRTPLNGILGMTQVLLTNRSLAPEVTEQVRVVHGAGETMRALVDDILDLAKMETGEVAVVDEEVDLHQLLDSAALLWTGHAQAKGLPLHVDIAGAPARVLSDAARLRQIVFNLLSNAVKFTLAGSIRLEASVESDERLAIRVIDTGIGIPPDQQDAIFDAFHQVDGGVTRQFSGTGLGLAICRKLAVALGCGMSVDSEPGVGSTFTLTVPLRRVEIAADDAPGPRPTTLRQAALLVVEGNAMTQGVLRTLLETATGSVAFAQTGDEALAALARGGVDHLLIEARSGTISGHDPVASLRRLIEAARAADVRTTLLLAPADDLPLGDVAVLGADQLVLKPVGGLQLIFSLTQVYASAPAAEKARDAA